MELTIADAVVLALLAEGPRHGYSVHAELQRRDVGDWAEVSRPQIYYSLRKLSAGGLLAIETSEGSRGPERLQYRITEPGRNAVKKRLADDDWATNRSPPPFLTWLALSWAADPSHRKQMVERRKDFLCAQISKEEATLKEILADPAISTRVPFLMVSFTIQQFVAELRWLSELEGDLCGYTEQH